MTSVHVTTIVVIAAMGAPTTNANRPSDVQKEDVSLGVDIFSGSARCLLDTNHLSEMLDALGYRSFRNLSQLLHVLAQVNERRCAVPGWVLASARTVIMRCRSSGPTSNSTPAVQRTSKRCCPRLSLGFELDSIERYVPFSDGFGLTACVLLRAFSFETRHR